MISQRQVVLYTFKRTLFWVGTHNDSRQMPFRPLRTGDLCALPARALRVTRSIGCIVQPD
jgi:hypothetical protein